VLLRSSLAKANNDPHARPVITSIRAGAAGRRPARLFVAVAAAPTPKHARKQAKQSSSHRQAEANRPMYSSSPAWEEKKRVISQEHKPLFCNCNCRCRRFHRPVISRTPH
jgi:hypothetical protein